MSITKMLAPHQTTITVKIPFLPGYARAELGVEIPSDIPQQWRLKAAVEIAHRNGANLDGVKLNGAKLDSISLNGARLVGANLDGASLNSASLIDAILVSVNLDGASLNRANLERANLDNASFVGTNLIGANLNSALLERVNLDGARLNGANLYKARLDYANLNDANLDNANLVGAGLIGTNLHGAHIDSARLDPIRNDFWDVLLRAQPEIPALLAALRGGQIDGSTYEGECACLVGTIAHARHIPYQELGFADSSRPIERWFLAIKKGDTPETNPIAKIAEQWILEFQSLTAPL